MENTRRILLAVTGLSPQIVTETLYALACRKDSPWIPHEIHVITTVAGKDHAKLNLLREEGWFPRMCRDYHLPQIEFPAENIHVVSDREGRPMDDIRTQEDNAQAADFITETVRKLTSATESELHVSIAGGRKTMGYYLGYALSLYGRPGDRLSHVLVSEPYEGNREFYYPTPYEFPIHTRRGDREVTVDARNAVIDLADIPFVRLRDGLPESLRAGKSTFTRVVDLANRGLEAPLLEIDVENRKVRVDGESVKLGGTEFAFLFWLAERTLSGNGLTEVSTDEMAKEFLESCARSLGRMSSDFSRIEAKLDEHRNKPVKQAKYFETPKSRINSGIEEVLGAVSAKRYQIALFRENDWAYYHLPLEAAQIRII